MMGADVAVNIIIVLMFEISETGEWGRTKISPHKFAFAYIIYARARAHTHTNYQQTHCLTP